MTKRKLTNNTSPWKLANRLSRIEVPLSICRDDLISNMPSPVQNADNIYRVNTAKNNLAEALRLIRQAIALLKATEEKPIPKESKEQKEWDLYCKLRKKYKDIIPTGDLPPGNIKDWIDDK